MAVAKQDMFTLSQMNLEARRGGGVGVLCRNGLKPKVLPSNPFSLFEHIEVSIANNKAHIKLVAIYRPPPSSKNKSTPERFLAEFATLLFEVTLNFTLMTPLSPLYTGF